MLSRQTQSRLTRLKKSGSRLGCVKASLCLCVGPNLGGEFCLLTFALLLDDNFELPGAKSLFLLPPSVPSVPVLWVALVNFCGLFSRALGALAGLELERWAAGSLELA